LVLLAAGISASIMEIFICLFTPSPPFVLCDFRRKSRRKGARVPADFRAEVGIRPHPPIDYVVHIE
jgi:hypothetical protein